MAELPDKAARRDLRGRCRVTGTSTRQALQADAFWQRITSHLNGVAFDERSAVIFVHGYNVSFEEAALRAAQIGFDLSIKGAMAFFSWPSQGTLGGYAVDAATIEASKDVIADFMTDFALH